MTTMERLEEGVYSYTRILLSYPDTQVLVMETPDTILKKLHT